MKRKYIKLALLSLHQKHRITQKILEIRNKGTTTFHMTEAEFPACVVQYEDLLPNPCLIIRSFSHTFD